MKSPNETQPMPESKFTGFEPPTGNFFRMPVGWTDITAAIDNLAELKVVEYILRHTWGYQEFGVKKHITVDEFVSGRKRKDGTRVDRGTGLSERGVRYGLKSAVQDGLIEEEFDETDPGRIRKNYGLKMRSDLVTEDESQDPHSGVQTLHPGVQKVPSRGADFAPRSEKDTSERDFNLSIDQNLETETVADTDLDETATQAARPPRSLESVGQILTRHHFRRHPSSSESEERQVIQSYISELADQLGDEAILSASVSRTVNIYRRSGVELGRFTAVLIEARSRTREYTPKIRKRSSKNGRRGQKNQFPYFLAIVEDILRRRHQDRVGR